MRRRHDLPAGTVHRLMLDSAVLRDNPLGDAATRPLHVYTPPGWQRDMRLPLLVDLVGFNKSGPDHVAPLQIGENLPERLDRLIGTGAMPAVVVAFPDCITALGGNQYINSAGTGRYADYLMQEVVPLAEAHFGCGGVGRRGLFGKSSGGFGALWHGMHYPDFWTALACHSGDMGFDIVYRADLPAMLDELARHHYSVPAFLDAFESADKVTPRQRLCRMLLSMAATYDPAPGACRNVQLPCDPYTGRVIAERWEQWLRHDPVLLAEAHTTQLRQLKGIWIDCGARDQFGLHYGARQLSEEFKRLAVVHVHEEFDDDHTEVDYRMDRSLPYLARLLKA
jgi:hypothetical protein